jgi:hypothetical protein
LRQQATAPSPSRLVQSFPIQPSQARKMW